MRVLSITHGPSVPGGVFEDTVRSAGHELERWEVPSGEGPGSPREFDAVMAFGGSMHPDEDERFAWLAHEEELLREVLHEGLPVVGVCLGAQMLARAAGGRVGPARAAEVGWHEVELTMAGREDPVLGVLPPRFEAFQWHHYAFEVPGGGAELARSVVSPQAFRLGRAWGLQFHAEVTRAMVQAWVGEAPAELSVSVDQFLAETDARIATWNEHGRRLCRAFLDDAASA